MGDFKIVKNPYGGSTSFVMDEAESGEAVQSGDLVVWNSNQLDRYDIGDDANVIAGIAQETVTTTSVDMQYIPLKPGMIVEGTLAGAHTLTTGSSTYYDQPAVKKGSLVTVTETGSTTGTAGVFKFTTAPASAFPTMTTTAPTTGTTGDATLDLFFRVTKVISGGSADATADGTIQAEFLGDIQSLTDS
jgi:hypothetical protein